MWKTHLQSVDVASWQQNDVIHQEIQYDFFLDSCTGRFYWQLELFHYSRNTFIVSVLNIEGEKNLHTL